MSIDQTDHLTYTNPDELLPVVDNHDNFLYAEKRKIVHDKKLFHRAVHVFVFNPDSQLWIQRRSQFKDTFPGYWEGIGGHLGLNDDYMEAAIRETFEEIGVLLSKVNKVTKLPPSQITNYEFIEVYWAESNLKASPNKYEIDDSRWVSRKEFEKVFIDVIDDTGIPELKLCPSFHESYQKSGMSQLWKQFENL